MDIKDCLTLRARLINEVIHEGCQGYVSAMKETRNELIHESKYSRGTLEAEG